MCTYRACTLRRVVCSLLAKLDLHTCTLTYLHTYTFRRVVSSQLGHSIDEIMDGEAQEAVVQAMQNSLGLIEAQLPPRLELSAQRLLDSHNGYRSESCVPPLEWDAELAQLAHELATSCPYGTDRPTGNGSELVRIASAGALPA